ncbi:MAG: site-2 protease family protein [Caldilineales bacterium]|nr:site-2 protease family protein [Caldilineales bacterium]MDW8319447.1 site-2 protease family protein [Anaerolineae bacterium]
MLNRSVEEIFAFALALLPAFTLHEFAHAWMAYRLGDPTAKNLGRLTLNPLKHLDVLGTLMVFVVGFGWAKPVPVNPYNLRGGRAGMALVAVVGPLSNLALAAVAAALWRAFGLDGGPLVRLFGLVFVYLNVALFFFNLIPLPPLDGYRVAVGVLPEPIAVQWARLDAVGPMLLFALILLSNFVPGLDLFGWLVGRPTQAVVSALLL